MGLRLFGYGCCCSKCREPSVQLGQAFVHLWPVAVAHDVEAPPPFLFAPTAPPQEQVLQDEGLDVNPQFMDDELVDQPPLGENPAPVADGLANAGVVAGAVAGAVAGGALDVFVHRAANAFNGIK